MTRLAHINDCVSIERTNGSLKLSNDVIFYTKVEYIRLQKWMNELIHMRLPDTATWEESLLPRSISLFNSNQRYG